MLRFVSIAALALAASCSRTPSPIRAWAGTYWDGIYNAGTTLTIASDGTFVCTFNGWPPSGDPERAAGIVNVLADGNLELEVREGSIAALEKPRTRVFPIEWDGSHFVLTRSDVVSLCDDFNGYSAPRNPYWAREPDDHAEGGSPRAWSTPPKVPAQFAKYLLSSPRVAHTKSVDLSPPDATLTVDIGSVDGAFVGMSMYVVDQLEDGALRLSEVDDHTSRGIWSPASSLTPAPTDAWQFSTRAPKPR